MIRPHRPRKDDHGCYRILERTFTTIQELEAYTERVEGKLANLDAEVRRIHSSLEVFKTGQELQITIDITQEQAKKMLKNLVKYAKVRATLETGLFWLKKTLEAYEIPEIAPTVLDEFTYASLDRMNEKQDVAVDGIQNIYAVLHLMVKQQASLQKQASTTLSLQRETLAARSRLPDLSSLVSKTSIPVRKYVR